VLLAHRGQAVGLVPDAVLLGADPEEAAVQQPHRAGEHAPLGQVRRRAQVGGDVLAEGGQRVGELDHVVELLLVAAPAPGVVVAVLLAAGVVEAGRLQVTAGIRTDPDVTPRRRDRQLADAGEVLRLVDEPAVGVVVREAAPALDAGDPWP
jgi:hypothetical protein